MISSMFFGNLGKDPVLSYGENKACLNFSVAVNYKIRGEKQTTWVSCVMFGDRAEKLNQMLSRGNKVGIQGKMYSSTYTDRSGHDKSKLNCIVDNVHLLTPKKDEDKNFAPDDIPF